MPAWQTPPKIEIPSDLLAVAGDPLLAQLLAQRGLTTAERAIAFLEADAYLPAPASELPDIDHAVSRLARAIEQQETVLVWGDFDVDGQTATALLVSTLQDLGAQVRYYIPNRLTESHGIKIPSLSRWLSEKIGILLTCDTGITEFNAVDAANAAGVDVIITDHHDLAESLPPALAVINPKRLPTEHPLRELPGVGVAYKLAEALYQAHQRPNFSQSLLDLVALGIVADVAHQSGDTRYLLQKGLDVLNQSERTGLQTLIENTRLKARRLTEEHIGFWLAPRLNALGRLGDANLAVELLTTDDRTRARIIALQLEALNDRRKLLVDRVVVQALSQLEDTPSLADYNAIVLAAADWHPGVIGIAANRLADQYGKPAILIALRPDGEGRGSARSVPGCDIHRALKTQADLLTSFGGHPLAAGLALPPENITALRRGLSAALADCRPGAESSTMIDVMVDLSEISMDLLATIQRLAPFGAGNPPVKLGCRGVRVVEEAIFGKTRDHKRLVVTDETGCHQDIIWWRGAAEQSPQGVFDLAFSLSPDDYAGDSVQVELLDFREWTPAPATQQIGLIDWRQLTNYQLPMNNEQSSIIWAEGDIDSSLITHTQRALRHSSFPRHQLHPADELVILTAPPGQDIFQQVVATVRPQRIYLIGQPSPFDAFPAFIKQLMGLVKYAIIHKEGEIEWEALAAGLSHRPATARLGIDWLAAQGKLSIYVEEEELIVVRSAQQSPSGDVETIETILKTSLAETKAYRQFFKKASLGSLMKVIK